MMLRRSVTAALIGLSLLGTACATEADAPVAADTTATGSESTTSTTTGFSPDPIEWDDCGTTQCAHLDVPLDYSKPNGETIELYAVRTPASGKRTGALFVNPGGPGASAAELADVLPLILPASITQHFDIVGVDPRGVGGSTPLDCGVDATELYSVDPTIETPADEAALLDVSKRYVDDCAAKYPELLAHVGTRDVARDMDVVRAAMGDEQLSYLGISYGTAIGQVYADLFPDRVRSMVIDGVLELGPTGLELADDQATGFELGLQRFVEYCDAAEGCGVAGESLEAVNQVLAMSEQPGGIPAPGASRPAGPGEATLGISYALYSQSLWDRLGSALAAARDGDGTQLVDMADGYIGLGDFEIYFAVNCMDFAWPTGDTDAFLAAAKASGERSPHFGEAIVNDYIRCADWPVPPTPLEATSAPGTPPILVISTTNDPVTPYEQGVQVAEELESGILVTNVGDGHGVVADGKPCIDDILAAYLVDDVVPEDGVVCD